MEGARQEGSPEHGYPVTSNSKAATAIARHMSKFSQRPKKKYSYVVIGAGTTAAAAIESILNVHPDADVLLLSDEPSELRRQQDVADPFESGEMQIGEDLLHSYNEWRRHISGRAPEPAPGTLQVRRRKCSSPWSLRR